MSMTLEERKEIAEEWVKYQENDFKVIVHVGTTYSNNHKNWPGMRRKLSLWNQHNGTHIFETDKY